MCYLFNFMLEIVWNLLLHAAKNQKPMHFSKQADSTIAWKLCVLANKGCQYGVPSSVAVGKDAKEELITAMGKWMPYKDNEQRVVYNKVGFWMHALRYARNVGTHRSLALDVNTLRM
eukprot:gene1075-3933_t